MKSLELQFVFYILLDEQCSKSKVVNFEQNDAVG